MVNYWERLGLLGPIYRLIARGMNDQEIAARLSVTEANVHECIGWLTRFLDCRDRATLTTYASATLPAHGEIHPNR